MNTVAWLMIAACIVTETVEQSLYRKGSTSPAGRRARYIVPAVALNVVGFAMWMLLIKQVPLGIALPLMGANFVTVALAGKFFFGERLNARRWLGIALVLAGFAMVAGSQA